jgi:hypothetical protein
MSLHLKRRTNDGDSVVFSGKWGCCRESRDFSKKPPEIKKFEKNANFLVFFRVFMFAL